MPLTEPQEGLWFAQTLDPGSPILNTGQYIDLTGPIDTAALMAALTTTLAEAEALRLRFARGTDGQPQQWLDPAPVLPQIVDLRGHADPAAEAARQMQADSARVLDLAREPVAAFTVFRLTDRHARLYERVHHLAIDGYGIALLTDRIAAHYSGLIEGTAPPPPFPGLERAATEDARYRVSPRRAEDAAWWLQAMADLPEVSGPAGGAATSAHDFLRESRWMDADLRAALTDRADRTGIAWPDLLAALTGAYLARWTGGEAVIGLPFMARLGRPIARLPCMAMNVLPHRLRLDEDAPLDDWLATEAAAMREERRHGLYRSEQLRRDLGRVGGGRRLYGPQVNVQPFVRHPAFAGLEARLHILGAGAVDDLTLTFRGDPATGLLIEVDANPALYSSRDVAGHAARLPDFLAAALTAERLADVPTTGTADRALITRVNATGHPLPDTTLTALIEAQMRTAPDAPAVVFGDTALSHAELDRRSAALAAQLQGLGAGPDRIVAVAMERSAELPLALLAILRAGAAYLPLDPAHPPARIARILELSRPVVTLTTPDVAGLIPDGAPVLTPADWATEGQPAPAATPGSLAYVIFTSGSTGEPKGVAVEHRAIVNRLLWMRDHYGFTPADRILQKTPATFDVSVWEFFLPLLTGAVLVMARPGVHRDPATLARAIRDDAITTIHFVPSMLQVFLAAPASDGLAIARVFCSGEALPADLRERFHRRMAGRLVNLYGPTEAAVDVSHWDAGPDDPSSPVPIGWPVWNTRLEVLDDRMRPVPPGLAGNLYLGGVQLARGYLGRDDLTAARFIPDPVRPGERLYHSGDLARRRHDGAVDFLGRSDHQVKLRGLRIELGEIEAAIMASGLARDCVVVARDDPGGQRLVAYVVPAPGTAPGRIAAHLAGRLPDYMIPAAEVMLDALPLSSNGKLDRKALPAPDRAAAGRAADGPTETMLARLYAEVLALPAPPPAEADFFALGGDSLSAVRLALRIEEETGRDPGLGLVFGHPVLARLAAALDAAGEAVDGLTPMLRLGGAEAGGAPLFLIHPAGGIGWGYRHLARALAADRPVWAIQHPGLDTARPLPTSLTDLARDYADRIAGLAPDGPVHLAGWSVGGIIAQDIAAELTARGRRVGLLGVLDSYPADVWRDEPEPDEAAALRALLAIAGHDPDAHQHLDSRARVVDFLREGGGALGSLPEAVMDGVVRVVIDTNRLVRGHRHRPFDGPLTHIAAGLDHEGRDLGPALWQPYARNVEALSVPFLHPQMASPEAAGRIAAMLAARMKV